MRPEHESETPEEMFASVTARRILVGLAVAYLALSSFSYALGHVEGLAQRLPSNQVWLWVLGPTALVGMGNASAGWAYAIATLLLAVFTFGSVESLRRTSAWSLAFCVASVVVWVLSCLLVIAAAI